jgi:hypothetical protein
MAMAAVGTGSAAGLILPPRVTVAAPSPGHGDWEVHCGGHAHIVQGQRQRDGERWE